jgi:hypothetical protein
MPEALSVQRVCLTDRQLDTSTNCLKHAYTSTWEIYEKTYFLENVHLKIIYNFYNMSFCLGQTALKWHFYEQNCTLAKIFDISAFDS